MNRVWMDSTYLIGMWTYLNLFSNSKYVELKFQSIYKIRVPFTYMHWTKHHLSRFPPHDTSLEAFAESLAGLLVNKTDYMLVGWC